MFKIMTLCEEQSVFSEINYGVSLDFNNIWPWDSKEPMRFDNVIKALIKALMILEILYDHCRSHCATSI